MANTFNAITTGTGGIATTGDSSGSFAFQKDGVNKVTISDTGVIGATAITGLTTALSTAQGGTGLTAAGTSGNVLTSDGTNWTSAALPSSAPTTAQVQSAMASSAVGDLGTYAFLRGANNTALSAGSNYAGSSLAYGGGLYTGTAVGGTMSTGGSGSAPSGTWKCMGNAGTVGSGFYGATLFLRVA